MSKSESAKKKPASGEVFAAWKEQAAELGGRDTMLQYRDSRDGTIELTGAHPSGLAQLLAGRPTRLSSLIRDHELLSDARRRARSIRSKADQLASERGIRSAHLAIGFASWTLDNQGVREEFSAPVILRHIRIMPRGSRVEDFEIVLDDEVIINPALVDYLAVTHDVEIPVEEWIDATGNTHGFDPEPVFVRLRALVRKIPGMLVNQRLVISTFANISTPYSTDPLPEQHPILRALAGDPAARQSFGAAAEAPAAEDTTPPESDPAESGPAKSGLAESAEPAAEAPTTEDTTTTSGDEDSAGPDAAPSQPQAPTQPEEQGTDDAPPAATSGADTGTTDSGAPTEAAAPKDTGASAADREAEPPEATTHTETATPLPDRKPQEEFLAIDVDGDQQAVVDAALAGKSLVVDTPPGTGATQLAVALATTMAHTGHSVLFLAQNSDALDDFAARMRGIGLDQFAVDGRQGAQDIKKQLISLIGSAEKASQPQLGDLLDQLNQQREALAEHANSLHRRREPWGWSVYETMQHLASLTADEPGPVTSVRLGQDILRASANARDALRAELLELSALGAFTLDVEDTVWFGAALGSIDDAQAARRVAERIAQKLPDYVEQTEPVLREAGFNPQRTFNDWSRALQLLLGVRQSLDVFSPDVYDHNLSEYLAATGSNEYRAERGIEMGMFHRNRVKKAAREFLRPGAHVDDLHAALQAVTDQRVELHELAGHDARPKVPRGVLEADELRQEIAADIAKLRPVLESTPDGGDLGAMLIEEFQARAEALGHESARLAELPTLTQLDNRLREQGLAELLDDLRSRRVDHQLVRDEFDLAYWASVLQTMAQEDPQIGRHDGEQLHRIAADYRICDRQYVAAGASRLRYSHARGWKKSIEAHTAEAKTVRDQLRSQHTNIREMSAQAPTVFTRLAPVWMTSPFQVPELFAATALFDTVIIADAGRLATAEVLPAIARAKQVIVLGDDRLLGPKEFSVAVDRRIGRDLPTGTSVLGELGGFLPRMRLHTSYRSSPVGLVELANRHFYDSVISSDPTAFTGEGTGLEFAYVANGTGPTDIGTGQVESLEAEVNRVVELVLKHARTRPRQSLAVVTLTPHHAQRVATAIAKEIRNSPYVASFFTDTTKEPFVVTDSERIQGMARDAVIFSLGYGRTTHGRVIHNFGALSQPGGERLLAAALTRARRKLTIVSCFEPDDFDPGRLDHGAALLPGLLAEVAAGGVEQAPEAAGAADPLLTDITERLLRLGVMAHQNYQGVDLAVANSADDDHGMIVAVDGDGPRYAATASIRARERLRPEQLARRGWRFMRVWATDAFVDPQAQADTVFAMWKETVEELSPQAVLNAARAAAVVVGRRGSRPKVQPGLRIKKYSADDLDAMVDWVQSDGVARSDEDIAEQLRAALAQPGHLDSVRRILQDTVSRFRARHARAKRSGDGAAGAGAGAGAAGAAAGDVFVANPDAGPDAEAVMPNYDTGKLRAAELMDAGLIAADEADSTGDREAEGRADGEADGKAGRDDAEAPQREAGSRSDGKADPAAGEPAGTDDDSGAVEDTSTK